MSSLLAVAEADIDVLHREIDGYERLPRGDQQLGARALRIVEGGVGVVKKIQEAQTQLEEQLEQLDALKEKVCTDLNPKIDSIVQKTSELMNGLRTKVEARYEEYYLGQQDEASLGSTPVLKRPRMSSSFHLESFRAIAAANAVMLVGILVALAISRLEWIPHGATFIGFLAGSGVVIVAKMLAFNDRGLYSNGHAGHVQTD